MTITSTEIRARFLAFFAKRAHTIIPSASLVPEHDPTVLFNTAGMQPLVPYLMGAKHPQGTRLVNSQLCVRTVDIDDIGDNTHATFFEMLGNWSLGDYFKKEAIQWSYEFLISKEEGLGLDPQRLYVTVFAGDSNAPRDTEAFEIWKSVGMPEHRIYFKGAEANWWPAVKGKDTWTGPTGPCSEMFYDVTEHGLGDMSPEQYQAADARQDIVEIWNDVFMEYEKREGLITGKLTQKNVDTGAGLERITMVTQKKKTIFDTDLFDYLLEAIQKEVTGTSSDTSSPAIGLRESRIIADHVRTAVFILAEGVTPSNTDRGYIVRRLLRRAIRYADIAGMSPKSLEHLINLIIEKYRDHYTHLGEKQSRIIAEFRKEYEKFQSTLQKGLKEFNKLPIGNISGLDAFQLFTTYGFPLDIIIDLAKERGNTVDTDAFQKEITLHQEKSRLGAEKKFKGGLADTSLMSVRYHTATHLLQAGLRKVLGTHVTQAGSNITPERLRFDFTHSEKMTDDQKKAVEKWVNNMIQSALPVVWTEIPLDEARARGALGVFDEKYGTTVKVYSIGLPDTDPVSLELCGGPHVNNTSELGVFSIQKEEAVSTGIRRIKAILTTT